MNTIPSEIKYGSNKLLVAIKIVISLSLFIIVCIILRKYGADMTYDIERSLRWINAIAFIAVLDSLGDLREHYIILSKSKLTYVYISMSQDVTDVFEWWEIESFEKSNSFIFFKKIKIVTNGRYYDDIRNCNIWIHHSKVPRDELCDILNERLEAFKQTH